MSPRAGAALVAYVLLLVVICLPVWGTLLGWWHFPGLTGRILLVLEGAPVLLASAGVRLARNLVSSPGSPPSADAALGGGLIFIYWALILWPGRASFRSRRTLMVWIQGGTLLIHLGLGGLVLAGLYLGD